MVAHGVARQPQPVCDSLVVGALADELKDLAFPFTKVEGMVLLGVTAAT